jgi:putative hydrolase of the HAD superfamily
MRRTVVFDGDDTLWETEFLYDSARTAARKVVEQVGIDGAEWEAHQRQIDVANVQILGMSAVRFPTSCRQAYEACCNEGLIKVDQNLGELIYRTAESVFISPAPVFADSRIVLESLAANWQLVLLTKGDEAVQEHRIADSGLSDCFDLIRIVPSKGVLEWQDLILALDLDVAGSWSVGNSIGSDIEPAIQCGLWAAWIPAHVWEHEYKDELPSSARCFEVEKLSDLPRLLEGEE